MLGVAILSRVIGKVSLRRWHMIKICRLLKSEPFRYLGPEPFGQRDNTCKCPEVGVGYRDSKKASVAGVE